MSTDPDRGTGRTTRVVIEAVSALLHDRSVVVLTPTERQALRMLHRISEVLSSALNRLQNISLNASTCSLALSSVQDPDHTSYLRVVPRARYKPRGYPPDVLVLSDLPNSEGERIALHIDKEQPCSSSSTSSDGPSPPSSDSDDSSGEASLEPTTTAPEPIDPAVLKKLLYERESILEHLATVERSAPPQLALFSKNQPLLPHSLLVKEVYASALASQAEAVKEAVLAAYQSRIEEINATLRAHNISTD